MDINRLALFDSQKLDINDEKNVTTREVPEEILLVKFGKNSFTKNGKHGEFEFTKHDAESVISEFSNRGRDLVIDYEHETLKGSKAPAAGWIDRLLKTDEGLAAGIKYWTEQATEFLEKGEYRYFSPVLTFSRRGKSVSALHSVALTNHPAMHKYPALVADDSAAGIKRVAGVTECGQTHFRCQSETSAKKPVSNNMKGEKMNELLNVLGLTALDDLPCEEQSGQIVHEVKKLIEEREKLNKFLTLHDMESLEATSIKIGNMAPSERVELLKGELAKRDATDAVNLAFSEGKLAASSKEWALGFAETNLEQFNEWVKNAPVIIPDNEGIHAGRNKAAKEALSDVEKKVFHLLGLTDEQVTQATE